MNWIAKTAPVPSMAARAKVPTQQLAGGFDEQVHPDQGLVKVDEEWCRHVLSSFKCRPSKEYLFSEWLLREPKRTSQSGNKKLISCLIIEPTKTT